MGGWYLSHDFLVVLANKRLNESRESLHPNGCRINQLGRTSCDRLKGLDGSRAFSQYDSSALGVASEPAEESSRDANAAGKNAADPAVSTMNDRRVCLGVTGSVS